MDDYQTYLNALQSSNYITQLNEFNQQLAEGKKEADMESGSLITAEGVKEGLSNVVGVIKSKVSDVATDLVGQAKNMADDAVQGAISSVNDAIAGAQNAVSDTIQGAIKTAEGVKYEALSMLSQKIQAPITTDLLPESAGNIFDVGDLSSTVSRALQGLTSSVENRVGSSITGGLEELSQMAQPSRFIPSSIENEFEEEGDILGGPTNRLLSGSIRFAQPLETTANDATQAVSEVASSAVSKLSSTFGEATEAASNAVSGTLSTISNSANDLASSAVGAVSDAVQSASTAASTAASSAVDSIASTVSDVAAEAASTVAETVGATVSGALGELGPVGLLIGGLVGGITELIEGSKDHANQGPVLNPAFQFL
jgi:phage-related protein